MQKKGRKQTYSLSAAAITATILSGGLLAFGVCGAGLAGCSGLVLMGRLGEGAILRCCCICLAVGCFLGSLYAAGSCRTRVLPISLGAGLFCWAVWVTLGILAGGAALGRAGLFLCMTLLGSGAAGLLVGKHMEH